MGKTGSRERVGRVVEDYLVTFRSVLASLDVEVLSEAVDLLRAARDAGNTIFIAGNGGSAAIATHLVNDLGKATKQSGRAPIRVMCLSDNTSWLTALANDEGYERVFTGQLENFARPGDVLIVISSSGNSPNVIAAVDMARAAGVRTIGLTGFDGGAVRGAVDVSLWLESSPGAYGPVETAHALVCDLINTCLMVDKAEDGAEA
jgi:D-sedoheptulose 7-phosphate isomerase